MKALWTCAFLVVTPALVGCAQPARTIVPPPPCTISTDTIWSATLMPLPAPGATDTIGLRGGDGAASCPIPNNRTLWLFGDSWIGRIENGRYAPGAAMPNNVALVHNAPRPGQHADNSTIHAAWGPPPKPGIFSAFIAPPDADAAHPKWCWPCDGAVTLGPKSKPTLAIFYADLARRVENPTPDDVWNFRFTGNRIAIIDNPAETLDRWHISQHPLTPRDPARMKDGVPAISWGVVAIRHPAHTDTILIFGIDGTNPWDKLLMLAAVPEPQLTNFAAWRFWVPRLSEPGAGFWSAEESDAAPIAHNAVDELTIHKQHFPATPSAPAHDRWLLIQGEPLLGPHILVRTADSPLGPWSDCRPIYTIPEPATDKNLITYGAKAHPHLSGPDELLISYCINSTDFGAMTRDVGTYRPRFIHVPLKLLHAK